jgi:hypothetical protein
VADAGRKIHHTQPIKDIRQFAFVFNDLKHIGQLANGFGLASCIAAHDDRLRARIVFGQSSDELSAIGIGVGCDRACIHNTNIRGFTLNGFSKAISEQCFANELRFVLVDFATQRYESAGAFWHFWRATEERNNHDAARV